MGRSWCAARRTGRRRPPLLLPMMTSSSLLLCCGIVIAMAAGAMGESPPVPCEENPCQNEGICYYMNSAITDAISGELRSAQTVLLHSSGLAQSSGGSTGQPSAATDDSDTYHKPRTSSGDSYHKSRSTSDATSTEMDDASTEAMEEKAEAEATTLHPKHTTSPRRNSLSTASTKADGGTTTTTTTAATNATASSTPDSDSGAALVPGAPASIPSPPASPSPPPELQYTVGVLQPKKEAPLTLCPPPFMLIHGFCLHLTDSRQGAEDSRRLCRSLGGRLADVGAEDVRLLTRLMWPPPPPPRRGLYAWVDGAVGQLGRRRREKRTLIGRRLCTAAAAATGSLALRHCEEPHRALCERAPLSTVPHRSRRSADSTGSISSVRGVEQSCHCEEGYGGDTCVRAVDNEGHEYEYCKDTQIGDRTGPIIVDFAAMGRLPWETRTPPANCPSPDVPLPADSEGCVVPSSEAILRYWCQGKTECTPSIDYLAAYYPLACQFDGTGAGSEFNVSMRLYLRYRDDKSTSVGLCREGGTYDRETRTCYVVTSTPGYFNDQLSRCRDMGGDIIYGLDTTEYPGYISLIKTLVSDLGSVSEVWASDTTTAVEPRPVVDMTDTPTGPQYPCLSLNTGTVKNCGVGQRQYAVCAMPPFAGEAPSPCPPVRFDEYGLVFPETAAGKTVTRACGVGYTGDASYTCGLDGQWSSQYPDLSQCRSDDINTDDVQLRLDSGTEPVSDIVSDLTANVTKRTSQNKPLTSGDVINSVLLLPQMVSAQQAQLTGQSDAQKQTVAKQYLGNVTSLVSGLTRGETSWHGMPETERFSTSTLLQTNVEQSAYLLAAYLDDQRQDFNDETIRLRTGRYSSLSADSLRYVTQQGSTVTLPDEVARFNQSGRTTIVFVEYGNMDCLLSGQKCSTPDELHQRTDVQLERFVNSPLVSASVGNTSVTFSRSNVTIAFKTRLSAGSFNISNHKCAFWDDKTNTWSESGCSLGRITNESVECLCSHLTSFATLMDINGIIEEGSALDLALSWLTTIGCVISLISLAICLVVFTAVPTLRSERTSVHRNLCFCLFTAEFILLVGLQPHGNATGCAVVAGLLHFFFLAAFAWMCIEGVQIYLMVYKVFATRKSYMRYFYVCGYGIPALIVTISLSVTKGEGYGSETACWLSTDNGLIWAFAGPLLLVVCINIFALAMALRVTARATKSKGRSTKAPPQASTWIRGSASLVAILGTTWLFGFLYFTNGLLAFSVIFTILNSLQGFFIFLFHVWLNDKNRTEAQRFMWKTTNRLGLTEHDLTSTSAGVTSRAHGGNTVETSVAATPAVSTRPDAGTGNGSASPNGSASASGTPTKTKPAGNLLSRALRRVNGTHYSVKRINGEGEEAPPPAESHKRITSVQQRAAESGQPARVNA